MTSDSATALASLLSGLAVRARETADNKPDLTPAIGLVIDLGRLTACGPGADIRLAQAAVAGVREQLVVGEHAINTPEKALLGVDGQSYLAGALWAVNELMTARLEIMTATTTSGRQTRRSQIRKLVAGSLLVEPVLAPTAILSTINSSDIDARLDEVSRAIGELLDEGLVESAQPEPGSDRRMKYFALTAEGRRTATNELSELYAGSSPGT